MLKPDVKQMIMVGIECGLQSLEECYQNYMMHDGLFFSYEDFSAQYSQFVSDLDEAGLLEYKENGIYMKDISAKEALAMVEND